MHCQPLSRNRLSDGEASGFIKDGEVRLCTEGCPPELSLAGRHRTTKAATLHPLSVRVSYFTVRARPFSGYRTGADSLTRYARHHSTRFLFSREFKKRPWSALKSAVLPAGMHRIARSTEHRQFTT
ncbi:hypothetical protein EVAR_14490_1 [Eumeta japonica]|uniref:Uncharacterized protein n=1 Tax=Eumeta variegata TaxID=151549 RepID=A0A4C1U3X6_EUMVA|nr:hypothetical protein EVAR_14490_1 [Eumeta japonica]